MVQCRYMVLPKPTMRSADPYMVSEFPAICLGRGRPRRIPFQVASTRLDDQIPPIFLPLATTAHIKRAILLAMTIAAFFRSILASRRANRPFGSIPFLVAADIMVMVPLTRSRRMSGYPILPARHILNFPPAECILARGPTMPRNCGIVRMRPFPERGP